MSEPGKNTSSHLVDIISKFPTPPLPNKEHNAQTCSSSQIEAKNTNPQHPTIPLLRLPSTENFLPKSPTSSGEEQNVYPGSSSSHNEPTTHQPSTLPSPRPRSAVENVPSLISTASEGYETRPGFCIPGPPRPDLQTRGLFAGRKLPPLNFLPGLEYNADGTFYRGAAVYYKVLLPNLPNLENYQSAHMREKRNLLRVHMHSLGTILEHKHHNTVQQVEKKMLEHLGKIFSMSGESDEYETSAQQEETKMDLALAWLELIIRFQDPDCDLGPDTRTQTAPEGRETPAQKIQREAAEVQRRIELETKARAEAGTLPFLKSVSEGMKKRPTDGGINIQD
ncbi:hypothetical protein F53441_12215 [Fusarium austroafricanum]|uniref:Uncharacterized protein n=1 Tax=Fusarium austroafricanum TaxID=2364996 RepID=A0A8H4NML8_9HYPO|nr:hypothetical protein F53441_12215 [Fusarium austroafricanum]